MATSSNAFIRLLFVLDPLLWKILRTFLFSQSAVGQIRKLPVIPSRIQSVMMENKLIRPNSRRKTKRDRQMTQARNPRSAGKWYRFKTSRRARVIVTFYQILWSWSSKLFEIILSNKTVTSIRSSKFVNWIMRWKAFTASLANCSRPKQITLGLRLWRAFFKIQKNNLH